MTNLYNELKAQNADNDAKESEFNKEISKYKKKNETLDLEKDNLNHEIGLLKDQINSQKQQIKQLE